MLASSTLAFSPCGEGTRIRPTTFAQQDLVRPTKRKRRHTSFLRSSSSDNVNSENEEENDNPTFADTCWNPKLRKVMGGLAAFGALETAYLTASELQGNVPALLCSSTEQTAGATAVSASACSSVLTGPYAQIPGTEIPLAALGLVAYSTTLALAVGPLLTSSNSKNNKKRSDDTINRVLLTAVTTTMGVFSVFLMSLLFGFLHESCPYCVASAVCSILLAKLAWIGGALPSQETKRGIQLSAAGGMLSFVAALALFVTNYDPPEPVLASIGNRVSQSLLASAAARPGGSTAAAAGSNSINLPPYAPPAITTSSSPEALRLADDLKSLDASFYGAFWCSHCFDQKQTLGQQAMAMIPYVECSRDGLNANTALCKSKNVPGYPTWEIAGQLYPGEQALEELQEIVTKAKAGRLQ